MGEGNNRAAQLSGTISMAWRANGSPIPKNWVAVSPNVGAVPSDVCAEELDDDVDVAVAVATAADDDDDIDDRAVEEELLAKAELERAGTGTGRAVYRTSSVARASELIFLTALTMVL